MSSSSSASSSNTTDPEWMYDVYLSFTKEDVLVNSLILSMKEQLDRRRIRTYLDDFRTPLFSLLQAIEQSRISIVIFSEHYGGSSSCLQQLEKMMECHRAKGQVVFPVFFDVNIWEVRKQRGEFGEVFEEMITSTMVEEETLISWRRALAEAAFFPRYSGFGCLLREAAVDCGSFSMIGNIFGTIHVLLDSKYLSGPYYPVGIDVCAKDVYQNLSYNLERVHLIGIWGEGGIGKTSIAKVIYNNMCHKFEGSTFFANIKDVWNLQEKGKDYLQKQLLSDINKRALVVLDDVSESDQLKSLCGSRERFGPGSVILITTAEKHLLDPLDLDIKYEMKKMDASRSLELFSWHAFRHSSPTKKLLELSKIAVSYCEGMPLALEVLGSLLLDRTPSEWEIIMKQLENNQSSNEVQNILKLSYDFLDDNERKIFLEIACFYIGNDRHNITQLLNGYKLDAEIGITKLIERNLLKVDKNNKIEMHDLLQKMGREMNHLKPKSKWIHNVFLSFRGADTRRSFTSHLCAALQNAGIEVYMDDKLERGGNISSSLLQAIEGSRISIIIFSINYANSRWCLQELEKIMECHRTIGQEVVPVFYDVEPSEVRSQNGSFGKEFEGLVRTISATKDMIITWKRALTQAANLSGWNLNNYRTEVELIGDILKTVTTKLDDGKCLFVADHPVGMESRVQDMIQLLSGESSNGVCIIGILGMGGCGKTTTAKAIYNEINQNFEGKCFLANIREVWDQDNGKVYLQEQLLLGILKTRRMKIHNIDLGRNVIKESLCQKRVLVVLDDINNLEQLNAFCGSREWFGEGSRIIITTRDEHLLNVLHVDNIYRMKEMDESESLELFSWHAFKQVAPIADFTELSRRVVAYSGRLPLALEVLGSYLFERGIAEWESALSKLEMIPNDQIQKKLKISYDGLSDDMEKDIFLDICCFFIGKERNYVTQILDGCGLRAEIGIIVLIERSLLKVDQNNKLEMHDLLKAMGREIIRDMSPENPEERSRLWFHEDVVDVITNKIATIAVKGLAFSLPKNNDVVFETKSFKKMKRLRLLQLGHVKLTGDFEYLSKDLRWLCWHGFPLRYMPGNFHLNRLVAMDLKHSNLQLVWKEQQFLDRLKILNLSHSHYLTQTPDFTRLPNLEKLLLKDCPQLSKVHSTIGDLKFLILLNLKDCKSLCHLPKSFYKLKSLKSLVLTGCLKIDKLEEDIMQMESLTNLMADNTAITQVPNSLVILKSIRYVSLCGYEGFSNHVFPSLILSLMSPSSNPTYKVFGHIKSSLQSLSLGLYAKKHAKSKSRPITHLITYPETSTKSNTSHMTYAETSTLIGLQNSLHIAGSGNSSRSLIIHAGECNKVTDTFTTSILQESDDKRKRFK